MARVIYFDENNPNFKDASEKIHSLLDYDIEEDIMSRPATNFFFDNLGNIENECEEGYYEEEIQSNKYV